MTLAKGHAQVSLVRLEESFKVMRDHQEDLYKRLAVLNQQIYKHEGTMTEMLADIEELREYIEELK